MLYRYQAGMGAVPSGVTISVRELQQQLVRAGFNVGPTGIDGVWGPKTQSALHRAFNAANLPAGTDWAYSASRGSITLTAKAWRAVQNVPSGRGGDAQESTTTPRGPLEPYAPAEAIVPLEEAADTTPWLIAGGALLAVGAYFYLKKKPVRRNRRRRRRRRR